MVLLYPYSLKWKILSAENAQFPSTGPRFIFLFSLSLLSFLFFLFIRSFASCYTTMMNSNIYRRFYKYTRKIYSSLLHFYLRSLRPPRYLIFFLSYSSSSFFFFNVTGNRTREHKSEQNGRYPFNQDSFITWSNILVNFSPTFLRFLPFFPPLPLSSFFPL